LAQVSRFSQKSCPVCALTEAMTDALRDVYYAFAGGVEMDGRAFVKCLRDSGLVDDRLKTVQADLIFARCRQKGCRKLSFDRFLTALHEVAQKRSLRQSEVVDMVCLAHGPDYESNTSCAVEEAASAGPERFFYDKTTYTGMHKCGSQARRPVPSPSPRTERRLRRDSSKTAPAESWAFSEDLDQPVAGPERFYYDRSTYTGTHKHNGPTAAGSGVGKEGYSDLSVLVRREIVQNDDLQRRRQSQSKSVAVLPSAEREKNPLPTLLGSRPQVSPRKEMSESAKQLPRPAQENRPIEIVKPAPAGPAAPAAPLIGSRYLRPAHEVPFITTTAPIAPTWAPQMAYPVAAPWPQAPQRWVVPGPYPVAQPQPARVF